MLMIELTSLSKQNKLYTSHFVKSVEKWKNEKIACRRES